MIVTRYKPLFSITATYEIAPTGTSAEGLLLEGAENSNKVMTDLRLKPQYKNNTATIFYEGVEKPSNLPTTSEPVLLIDSDKYFYFTLNFSHKEKIKKLKFHSTPAIQKEIGFPLLYDASMAALAGPANITAREDVKVISPVFSLVVAASLTGSTSEYANLEIRDEKNVLVDLHIPAVKLNDKAIDGPGAIPEFSFSVDASSLQPGVYEFKVGNFKKKFFLATGINISTSVSLIRVLKNNFLDYNKNLANSSCATFSLLIPKV